MPTRIKMVPFLGALAAAAIVAACGGGGSSLNSILGGFGNPTPTPSSGNPSPTPSGGHPSSSPSSTPSTSPSPTATAALSGTMQLSTGGTYAGGYTYAPAAAGQVVFSCGCTAQAGTTNADGSGSFTLVQNSTATPSAPNPTYTIVPGRNYVIIAQGGAGAQAWTTQFAGKVPAHNLYLGGTNASDVFTAAVSLYVFQESTNGSEAFDDWNFYNLQAWYNALKTSPNAQETTLLNDIAAQSALSKSLYPSHPTWNPSQMTNVTIFNDLNAVKGSGDATIPTPCPTNGAGDAACTGAPSP